MPAVPKPDVLKDRLVSLDVYRGLIMIALAFNGFGLMATAKLHLAKDPDSAVWKAVFYQFEHVEWAGCGFWDLIQPSFMFMVGVAAAFSYAKRRETGHSEWRLFLHVVWRSLILVFLGIFLISSPRTGTNWSLMNVLTQIGLGYPFLYLLWGRSLRTQTVAAVVLLVGTWLAYTLYPYSGINLETGNQSVGITKKWAQKNLEGMNPSWHKNANVGHEIDLTLLNLLPEKKEQLRDLAPTTVGLLAAPMAPTPLLTAATVLPRKTSTGFTFNSGGYQTINFIPSLVTMLFGLMCGELQRTSRPASDKLRILFLAALGGFVAGQALALTGICPLVKRIWTPSWAIFSTAWCVLILASLYALIDVLGWKKWTFPFVVVGMNSIAMYCMGMLLKPWTAGMWQTHLGPDIFHVWGELWQPTVRAVLVGFFFWLVCLWMYRQKIFIRI